MRKIYTMVLLVSIGLLQAQVGINTDDPQSTLDVNGDVIIRTVEVAAPNSNYDFLVHNNSTNEVQKVNGNFSMTGVNTTLAKAVERNGVTLLSATGFAGWQKINFDPANVKIDSGGNFTASNDFYTVPSNGIYRINYDFRYGNGVLLSVLNFSGTPSIGILKHTGGSYTVLDEKKFSGTSIPLLVSAMLTATNIDGVYKLTAGDRLSFEVNAGGMALGLLSSSSASAVIYKISD